MQAATIVTRAIRRGRSRRFRRRSGRRSAAFELEAVVAPVTRDQTNYAFAELELASDPMEEIVNIAVELFNLVNDLGISQALSFQVVKDVLEAAAAQEIPNQSAAAAIAVLIHDSVDANATRDRSTESGARGTSRRTRRAYEDILSRARSHESHDENCENFHFSVRN